MKGMTNYLAAKLAKFRKSEDGVTAIEYGLIAGAIAVAIIATLLILGDDINSLFESVSDSLGEATGDDRG